MDFRHILNTYAVQYGKQNFLNYLDNDIATILNNNDSINNYISPYLLENNDIFHMLHMNGYYNTTYHVEFLTCLWDRLDINKQKQIYYTLL